MDDTEEEKVQLLESLRLQDAALSVNVDNSIVSLESDSDADEEARAAGQLETVPFADGGPQGSGSVTGDANFEETEGILVEENYEDPSEPSWADALEANQEYDAVLAQVEVELKMNLAKILKQLDEVQSKISSVTSKVSSLNVKSHWLYVFGMPYFKTSNFYPCPFNEDYHTKKRNNEICWSDLPPYRQWTPPLKKVLSFAVGKLSLEKCVAEAHLKRAVMRKELETAKREGNSEKVATLEQEVASFDINAMAQSMVDDVVANGEHDWLQISAKYLEGKQSAESCRSFWYMYLHPNINKAPYTKEEESNLSNLAEKYKLQDWGRIATALGTNRTEYQCFIVYQNKLNVSLKRNTWTASEDRKLLQTVEKARIGNFIPWGKVAYHMEGRTKTQVFNRWTYSVNPAIRKGRFTEEEDIMILAGVQMWGEDYQRISFFLQDRTTSQVRDRYKHYLTRPGMGVPWTVEDDEMLLKLTAQLGKNWAKIATRFPSKNRTQVRHRYSTLSKWREKHPNAPLTDAPSRCYNPQMYSNFEGHWDKATTILKCGSVEEMVEAKNSLVSSLIKQKHRKYRDPIKKKKPSIIETDLVNYFRCSFDVPGLRKKLQLKTGEAQKYAEELAFFLPLMKADLNLPSVEDITNDSSLTVADREILKAYLSRTNSVKIPHSDSHESEEGVHLSPGETNTLQPTLFCDVKAASEPYNPPTNIDYSPTHDLSSLYINLPLMNFDHNQVVADRNQDPAFFEPPIREPFFPDEVVSNNHQVKESYMCPPNLTTLVGLRTFLLNRRNLLTWSNENLDKELRYDDKMLEETKQKFDERMMCLFLWPALMSRYGPTTSRSIFLEDDVVPQKKVYDYNESQNFTPMAKASLTTRYNVIPSTSTSPAVANMSEPPAVPSTSKLPAVPSTSKPPAVPSTSKPPAVPSISKSLRLCRPSGPPKKRRKTIQVEEDIDSDNPDFF